MERKKIIIIDRGIRGLVPIGVCCGKRFMPAR